MNENEQNQQQQVQLKITDEILKGVYANLMMVNHTKEEFVLDFANLLPPNGIVNARVIVSPEHMKRILAALDENVKKYEQNFGKIEASEQPKHQIGFKE